MGRWLYVVAIALALGLCFVSVWWNAKHDPTAWLAAGITVVGLFALWTFPKFATVESSLPFYGLYVASFMILSINKEAAGTNLKPEPWLAALPFTLVALFVMLRQSLSEERRKWTWAVFAGMVLIGLATAFFSGSPGGPGRFMAFLKDVLHLSQASAETVNFFFRKSVHVVAYGLLALSAGKAAQFQGGMRWRPALAAYAWAVPHAVLDELAQSKVKTRTGSPWDVLLDIGGMTLFLLLAGAFKTVRHE